MGDGCRSDCKGANLAHAIHVVEAFAVFFSKKQIVKLFCRITELAREFLIIVFGLSRLTKTGFYRDSSIRGYSSDVGYSRG